MRSKRRAKRLNVAFALGTNSIARLLDLSGETAIGVERGNLLKYNIGARVISYESIVSLRLDEGG